MLTRKDLKSRARESLKNYYWAAVAVVCLEVFLTRGLSSSGTGGGDVQAEAVVKNLMDSTMLMVLIPIILITVLVAAAIGILYSAFVGNLIVIGSCRFFMESREYGQSRGIGRLFYAFKNGSYWNCVKTMFMMNLFIFLWSLLLLIPGIVKSYAYRFVPYILAENPQMDWRDAIDFSKKMTDGQKMEMFVLDLSFLGLELLCALPAIIIGFVFGAGVQVWIVGVLFASLVGAYIAATYAELYAVLRTESGEAGRSLCGFGE